MTRYRATVGGNPLGPWRSHREVALVDAVDAAEASLDPDTGRIFAGLLTKIEKDDADEPQSEAEDVTAAAVETLHHEGNRAPVYAQERARGFEGRQDGAAERWRKIGREADGLLRRADDRRAREAAEE